MKIDIEQGMVEALRKLKDLNDQLFKERRLKNCHVYLQHFQEIEVVELVLQQNLNNLESWEVLNMAQQNLELT